jgi:hypothetical protein
MVFGKYGEQGWLHVHKPINAQRIRNGKANDEDASFSQGDASCRKMVSVRAGAACIRVNRQETKPCATIILDRVCCKCKAKDETRNRLHQCNTTVK